MTAIPEAMRDERRWLLWRYEERDGHDTKVPYRPSGYRASSTNPDHWSTYEAVRDAAHGGDYSGLGFVLGDGWAGVDLDDVLVGGELAGWAQDVVDTLDSYTEVSPSGQGVKVFLKAEKPEGPKRRKVELGEIEVYDSGRYFAVTGDHLGDTPTEAKACQRNLERVYHKYVTAEVVELETDPWDECKRKLEAMRDSVSGDAGHDAMFAAACEIRRWGFDDDDAWRLLRWFNDNKCSPPWSETELEHKWKGACDAEPKGSPELARAQDANRVELGLLCHSDFMAQTHEQNYLVDGVIVEGEHFVVGGPKKAFKTSILVDLAVSVAGGGRFLGQFDVPEAKPVIIVSIESGGATLQKTAARVQKARGVEIPDDMLYWGLRFINLTLEDHRDALERDILATGAKLCIIDPAYLMLLTGHADDAKNVFAMGDVLGAFGRVGVATGCTMCLAHHFKKRDDYREPVLNDLSQSGMAEWARQWLLLNHAKARKAGVAELHMMLGGSAGHGGEYTVTVDEGQGDGVVTQRKWDVTVRDENAERPTADEDFADQGETSKRHDANVLKVLEKKRDDWLSLSAVADAAKLNKEHAKDALKRLVEKGQATTDEAGKHPKYAHPDVLI